MVKCISNTNTNTVIESAINQVEKVREELYKLIESCNYNLQDKNVIKKSQELDEELNKKEFEKHNFLLMGSI
ncbi:MAG: aspartyl-phosphate phosphatase Spo0E family protein [Bacillota bacterium]|nr:aspartyl-phosphate phosphatase Spo0E family protein [Bacillota bacterium]